MKEESQKDDQTHMTQREKANTGDRNVQGWGGEMGDKSRVGSSNKSMHKIAIKMCYSVC